jgi:hypothetical protein
MSIQGGWIWVTPALVFAGLELYRGASGKWQRLKATIEDLARDDERYMSSCLCGALHAQLQPLLIIFSNQYFTFHLIEHHSPLPPPFFFLVLKRSY